MPKKKTSEDKPASTTDTKKSDVEAAAVTEVAAPAGKKLKPIDIVAIVVVTAIIAILGWTIYSKVSLKHDVTAAQTISDQTIAALQKRDGTAARKLGSASFQKEFTNETLTRQFRAVEVATIGSPRLENTTVSTSKDGKTVFFIYEYTALKVPYYVRVTTLKQDGNWKLIDISGNADESKLLVTN